MIDTASKKKAITIRIDSVLFEQFEALAKKEKRSFNNYIERVLTNVMDTSKA